eukprot:scaffold4784_cov388-Prasinococcus_capsulatus_cf.AAC.5
MREMRHEEPVPVQPGWSWRGDCETWSWPCQQVGSEFSAQLQCPQWPICSAHLSLAPLCTGMLLVLTGERCSLPRQAGSPIFRSAGGGWPPSS